MTNYKILVFRDNGEIYTEDILADDIGDAISIQQKRFMKKFPDEKHWETEVISQVKRKSKD